MQLRDDTWRLFSLIYFCCLGLGVFILNIAVRSSRAGYVLFPWALGLMFAGIFMQLLFPQRRKNYTWRLSIFEVFLYVAVISVVLAIAKAAIDIRFRLG